MKKTVTLTDDQVTAVRTALSYTMGAVRRFPPLPCVGASSANGYAKDIRAMEEAVRQIDAAPWEY